MWQARFSVRLPEETGQMARLQSYFSESHGKPSG